MIWKLEKQTGYDFVFNSELLGKYKNLNVLEVGTIDEVLKAILKGKALTYEVENNIYIIRKKEKQPVVKKNQQVQKKEIWGKVTDKDGVSLPGVSVVVKGTTIGAATNIDGEYRFMIPEDAKTLVFSLLKYKYPVSLDRTSQMVYPFKLHVGLFVFLFILIILVMSLPKIIST